MTETEDTTPEMASDIPQMEDWMSDPQEVLKRLAEHGVETVASMQRFLKSDSETEKAALLREAYEGVQWQRLLILFLSRM